MNSGHSTTAPISRRPGMLVRDSRIACNAPNSCEITVAMPAKIRLFSVADWKVGLEKTCTKFCSVKFSPVSYSGLSVKA